VSNSDFPKQPPAGDDDWGKTNFRHTPQPPSDDWGNTVPNIRHEDIDFNKTYMPGVNNQQASDWGNTQGNINLPQDLNFSGGGRSGGSENDYGATTPYFRLPDAERAKYQNVPPTPTQEAEKKRQEEKAKGGVPAWLWVSGGLLAMFLFTILVLMGVYIFILRDSGFEQTVKGVPQGSNVLVNGAYWGTTSADGTIILPTLRAGETKKVEIKHPNWVCEPQDVKGEDGVKNEPIIARCKQVANISNDCINIKAGAYETAERCANKALDELAPDFSVDDLLRAMNLYIIQFDSGKFDIPPRNMVFLGRAAGYLKKLPPTVVVEVGGHTDSDGSDAANQSLSENRAKAVREALLKFEIAPGMLTEKGYGETKPKTTNNTEDGKFQNRRIEYTAIKK
jgi:outer membrane protein OmpA-like peptidoglycan-associated protein